MYLDSSQIPLVVGVTGHMDLKNPDLTYESTKKFFMMLKNEFNNVPIILLSALAQGSDLLFVKAGFEVFPNAKLVAVLPFAKELYEKDFVNQLDEFRKYYDMAYLNVNMADIYEQASPEDGYEQTGEYIACNSNILLALWDGVYTKDANGNILQGGTSHIVDKVLEGNFQKVADTSIKYPKKITLVQIVSERYKTQNNKLDNCSYGDILVLFSNSFNKMMRIKIDNSFLKQLYGLDEFYPLNQIIVFNKTFKEKFNQSKFEKSKMYLLPQDIQYSNVINELTTRYAICDTVALSEQHVYKTVLFTFFVLICLTALAMDLPIITEYKFLIFAFFSFVMLCWNAIFKYFRGTNKYIDARVLAEILRVEIFWKLAGIKAHASEYIFQKEQGEMRWVKISIENWLLSLEPINKDLKSDKEFVYKHWLKNQADYYTKKAKWCSATINKSTRTKCSIALFCFTLAFIAGFIDFALTHNQTQIFTAFDNFYCVFVDKLYAFLHAIGFKNEGIVLLSKVIGFAKSLMFVIGGFVFSVASFIETEQGWSEHFKSFSKTGALFNNALNQYNKAKDEELKQAILFDLGKAALSEEEYWFVLHRKTIPGRTSKIWRRCV